MIPPTLPAPLRSLLLERGSLTRRLIAHSGGRFAVRLDNLCWSFPTRPEERELKLRHRLRALIREVTLLCNGRPAVYARSVIPAHTLCGRYRRLLHLGNRPLGEFLFTEAGVEREFMRIVHLRAGDGLFEGASQRAPSSQPGFWGRRSVFRLHHRPLLVTEIFLTDFSA